MKILLNNLSIIQMIEEYYRLNTDKVFIDLARCLQVLNVSNGPNDILLTGEFDSFLDIEIVKGITFRTEVRKCPDREAKGILLSRLSNYTKIDDLNGKNIKYSLSLFVSDSWKGTTTILNESSEHLKYIQNIPCFYSGDLLETINRGHILIGMCSQNIKDLINEKCANIYYHSETEKKYTELMRSNDQIKHNIINKMSELTCAINGFNKDLILSKKNRRDIYYNNIKEIYLSTDFLHGTFEIHSQDGTHQFEINCRGKVIEKADKTGKHDILI